ncbi:MAG: hypothetical protein ACJ8LG_14215 [Massilia sp.]
MHSTLGFAIVRLRFRNAAKKLNEIKWLSGQWRSGNCSKAEKKEFDEHRKTAHNLISLLLTNKTIRKRSKAAHQTKFFKN